MTSVIKERLHPILQRLTKCSSPFAVVVISDVAEVTQVEWNVMLTLRDEYYLTSQRVSDACFVEDVRVSAGAITDYQTRTVDQCFFLMFV